MKTERQPECNVIGEAPRRTVYIHIGMKTPSVNEWNNKKHSQWIYAKVKKDWRMRLNIIRRFVRGIEMQRAEIRVKRFTSTRFLDHGNASEGLKPIIDCLTKRNNGIGLIRDDNPTCMPKAPTCEQVKVNGAQHEKSVIIIKEIEE